jgi:hypothetical protein
MGKSSITEIRHEDVRDLFGTRFDLEYGQWVLTLEEQNRCNPRFRIKFRDEIGFWIKYCSRNIGGWNVVIRVGFLLAGLGLMTWVLVFGFNLLKMS